MWENPQIQEKLRLIPYSTLIGLLFNPETVPKWSCCNYQRILHFMEHSQHKTFNEQLLLVMSNKDSSPQVIPAEEIPVNPSLKSFKIRCFPQTIQWNKTSPSDINELHLKFAKLLKPNDFDLFSDSYLWELSKIDISESMSLIDKISVILTGYTYHSGTLMKNTPQRFVGGNPFDYKDVNDTENCRDISYDDAQVALSKLKVKMATKMKEIDK